MIAKYGEQDGGVRFPLEAWLALSMIHDIRAIQENARTKGETTWFALRLEVELALAGFVLPGLSLDYAGDGLVLTPRIEVSSPQIALIPSFWAGVGLPLRLDTDPDPGVRLMVGVALGPVGGLVSFDLRPGDDGLDHELTALFRVSL